MNQPAQKSQAVAQFRQVPIADHGGGGRLMPQTFGDVVEFSKIMAMSQHAIPKHLRDVPGACLAVTMQAMRWEMDPFAVASKSYSVKDLIAYEAQLIAAVVHTRAPLKSRPEYAYTGTGPDRRCTVSAIFDDGITRSYESPRVADIKTKNSPLWTADTDQQLGYFSIRSFARRYCPEVILGVYTPEEAETFRGPDHAKDITPRVPLAERLQAAQGADGFNQQHVINEIDGNQPQPSQAPTPPVDPETQPASVAPSPALDAGDLSSQPDNPGGAEPDTTKDQKTKPGVQGAGDVDAASILPLGWQKEYAMALGRAMKPASLPKFASQFWALHGGWDKHKSGPDHDTAQAIYDCFANHFTDAETRNAMLHELGAN